MKRSDFLKTLIALPALPSIAERLTTNDKENKILIRITCNSACIYKWVDNMKTPFQHRKDIAKEYPYLKYFFLEFHYQGEWMPSHRYECRSWYERDQKRTNRIKVGPTVIKNIKIKY